MTWSTRPCLTLKKTPSKNVGSFKSEKPSPCATSCLQTTTVRKSCATSCLGTTNEWLRPRTAISCLISCLRTTWTCPLFDMCCSRSICATSGRRTKRKPLLFVLTSSTWLHMFCCFRECAVTAAAANKPPPPPAPGSFGGLLLMAVMLAVATSCAENCRAGVYFVQTAQHVAAEHRHTQLQQLWTNTSGRINFQLLTAVSQLTEWSYCALKTLLSVRASPAKKLTIIQKAPPPPILRIRTWKLEALLWHHIAHAKKQVYENSKALVFPTWSRRDILENSKAPTFPAEKKKIRIEIKKPDQGEIWWAPCWRL